MPINQPSSHPVVHSSKHIQSSSRPTLCPLSPSKSSENSCPNIHGRRRNSSTHPNEKSLLEDGCGNLYVIRGTLTVQAEWGADLKLRDEGPGVWTNLHPPPRRPPWSTKSWPLHYFSTEAKKNEEKNDDDGKKIHVNMILTSLSSCRAPCLWTDA